MLSDMRPGAEFNYGYIHEEASIIRDETNALWKAMKRSYRVLFEQDEDGKFTATVPELPG